MTSTRPLHELLRLLHDSYDTDPSAAYGLCRQLGHMRLIEKSVDPDEYYLLADYLYHNLPKGPQKYNWPPGEKEERLAWLQARIRETAPKPPVQLSERDPHLILDTISVNLGKAIEHYRDSTGREPDTVILHPDTVPANFPGTTVMGLHIVKTANMPPDTFTVTEHMSDRCACAGQHPFCGNTRHSCPKSRNIAPSVSPTSTPAEPDTPMDTVQAEIDARLKEYNDQGFRTEAKYLYFLVFDPDGHLSHRKVKAELINYKWTQI